MYGEKLVLKIFDPKMSKFGQNFDQIWSLSKFQNHSQVSTCYNQHNLKYGPKKLMQSRIIKIIQFFSSIFKTYRIIFLSTTHKQGTSQVKSMVMNYTVTHPVRLLTSRIHQEILVTLCTYDRVLGQFLLMTTRRPVSMKGAESAH